MRASKFWRRMRSRCNHHLLEIASAVGARAARGAECVERYQCEVKFTENGGR